jgi:hypothetical protein
MEIRGHGDKGMEIRGHDTYPQGGIDVARSGSPEVTAVS